MRCLLCLLPLVSAVSAQDPPGGGFRDDPVIVEKLKQLKPNEAILLPKARILGTMEKNAQGPVHRDYCNKMPYAPDRGTGLYVGGSHQTWRSNDAWEYHLGSNTWARLFAPDGGNHAHIKATLYNVLRRQIRQPDYRMTLKQKEGFERSRKWWMANVVLKNGQLSTRLGGPIMPAHTWDAVTYDPIARKLLWASGAGPGNNPEFHARLLGLSVEAVKKKISSKLSRMWMFDPARREWHQHRQEGSSPRLAGMGATMVYIPRWKKSLYYVAAANVSPGDFGMWTFDAIANRWQELKPNRGRSIATMAHRDGIAPRSEQQTAYSPQHRKLVAVLKHETFAYDLEKNEWKKICTDKRIDAHDARSVFVYDQKSDVFLLLNPRAKHPLAAFSLQSGKWEVLSPTGSSIPKRRYGGYMGYYDPIHGVVVLSVDRNRMWAYRYGK